MLADMILLSVLVALIRGGRPSDSLKVRYPWMIFAALGLQLVAVVAPRDISPLLILASYAVLLTGLAFNLEKQSLRLIFVGVLLNAVVIGLNAGHMPVSVAAANGLGFNTQSLVAGADYKRVAMSDSTLFNFLGDVIPVPFPLPRVVSIGDVLIALGAFLLIQEFMSKPVTFRARRLSL
ncbi:MAG: DUF5317 domain-containing protein [Firmicutes bacterium]|nr:DUF5317 domain-containing protein [Bacillota bacterium]